MPDRTSGEQRLAAIHAQLVEAVEDLVHSDAWIRMLTVAARYPTYSPSNVLLIATQRPDATRVAGIRTWNSLGRHVTKGEHGIAILAPCAYRTRDDEPSPESSDPVPPPDDDASPPRRLRGFQVVHVFDVSQTEGDPLPDCAPELLTGDAPRHLWDHLAGLVRGDGYTLERGPCPSGVNGYTVFAGLRVRVRDDVDPAQAVKTLAHEVGHIRAEHATRFREYASDPVCRGQAELEAESIAYIVTTDAGMTSDPYSAPYVAGWSDGDTARIRDCLSRVVTVARGMIATKPATRHETSALPAPTRGGEAADGWPSAAASR